MDITSISAGYTTQVAQNALDSQRTKAIKSDYENSTDEELMDACKQFEQYFVEQIFKGAQKTIMKNETDTSVANSTLRSYYEDNMAKEVATMATNQQEFGLAKMMYEQMKLNQGKTIEEVDAAEAAKAAAVKADTVSETETGADTEESTDEEALV
ncbi:MAG: rod-binding protein [Lachnospiraceae bacterium]|nr:rod-binding protein [Lachnospiraceae bacterium]